MSNKAGRPSDYGEPMVRITVRLPVNILKELDKIDAERSEIIRTAIIEYLKE